MAVGVEGAKVVLLVRVVVSLLKIQFCAIEGKGQASATSPFLRGSTFIAMMQAANLWEGNNVMACRG
jgi:hypothetical protein